MADGCDARHRDRHTQSDRRRSQHNARGFFQTKLALYTSYAVAGTVTRDSVPDDSSGTRQIRITTCGPNRSAIISS